MSDVPAGWYPDPEDPGRKRYWDGNTWTMHSLPTIASVAPNADSAVTSLTLGILSLVLCGPFTGIPAMVLGRRAIRQIDSSGGRVKGRGLATAGFVTGLVGTVQYLFTYVLLAVLGASGALG